MKNLKQVMVISVLTISNLAYCGVPLAGEPPAQPENLRIVPPDQPAETEKKASAPLDREKKEPLSGAPDVMNLASGLLGMEIRNFDPVRLGKVDNLVFDYRSGKIAYVVMGRSGVLGLGDRQWAVPLSALNPSQETRTLVLNTTLRQLDVAKGLRRGQWPNIDNPSWGAEPFWKEPSGGTPAAKDATPNPKDESAKPGPESKANSSATPGTTKEAHPQSQEQPSKLNLMKSVCGIAVKDPQGAKLGSIADLVIDWKSEKVAYTVFSPAGTEGVFSGRKIIAIPLSAYQAGAEQDCFILNSTRERLASAKGLGRDDWPSVNNPDWGSSRVWDEPTPSADKEQSGKKAVEAGAPL